MKVLIVYNTMEYVWYRRFFLRDLLARGHEVVALGPFDGWEEKVASLGIRCRDLRISRWSVKPWQELVTLFDLFRIMRRERPDAAILYTIKPIIYGSLVAHALGIRRVFSLVTGLGYMFVEGGRVADARQAVARQLYKLALAINTRVFFQNADDLKLFTENGIVASEKAIRVSGSGVDTDYFAVDEAAAKDDCFLLVSRMLWDKGIALYVSAAHRLKAKYPQARFELLGPVDDNPASIPLETLDAWDGEGAVNYLGSTTDIRPFMARCFVYVLPSHYREGIPRTNLEALAMGKAIITTDTPGCRETVVPGVNGVLIKPRDEDALVEAMESFLKDPARARTMGKASRKLALDRFRIETVNQVIIDALEGDAV